MVSTELVLVARPAVRPTRDLPAARRLRGRPGIHASVLGILAGWRRGMRSGAAVVPRHAWIDPTVVEGAVVPRHALDDRVEVEAMAAPRHALGDQGEIEARTMLRHALFDPGGLQPWPA